LPARERQAARQASVVGHIFWDDALQALDNRAPQALPALQRAAFVRAHAQSDFEGTPERQFDHHLLHQVTYDTLLKAERRLGHGVVAQWLTARTQGRGPEFLAMTGEHAEKAGEAALALNCFEQAGLEAQKRYANSAAESYFRRALALLDASDSQRRFDLLQRLEGLADTVGDRARQDLLHAEMAALLERHPDDTRLAALRFSQALLADRRGDVTVSEPLARQAFETAERCGAARWAALAQGQLAWLHMARHDYAGAEGLVAVGMPWAGRIEDETARAETEAKLLTLSGMVALLTSRFEAAHAALTAVLARGAALGTPRLQLGALDNLGAVSNFLGRWDESVDWGERGLALARSVGSPHGIGLAQLRLGQAAQGRGETAAAIEWHERNLAIFETIGNRRMQAITRRFLAGLHLARGEPAVALQRCAESLVLFEDLKEPLEACEVMATSALCEVRLGRPEAARAAVNRALQMLNDELAAYPAHETVDHRWACQQTLEALDDARAAPLLEQLHADVQARAVAITDEADRERLIQALPTFRLIVAAQRRRVEPPALP
jgi:tetratricopeptide (TPR) repeat protein